MNFIKRVKKVSAKKPFKPRAEPTDNLRLYDYFLPEDLYINMSYLVYIMSVRGLISRDLIKIIIGKNTSQFIFYRP